MFRLRRDAAECEPRLGPEAAVAEVGVTYVSTLLALAGAEDACLQLHVCHAARHVASLPDLGGVVARLNKVAKNMDICTCIISILYIYILHYLQYLHQVLVSATALHLLHSRGVEPGSVVQAGDWGRAWQNCRDKYSC